MSELTRNDSSSVISSLQMDYGDSDDEDASSKDNSRVEEIAPVEAAATSEVAETANSAELSAPDISDSAKTTETSAVEQIEEPSNDITSSEDQRKTDSPLQSTSTSKIDSDRKDTEVSPVDFISDDEDGEGHSRRRQKLRLEEEKKRAMAEAVSADSPSSQGSAGNTRKATRLVSYGPDEDVDEESESEEEPEVEETMVNSPEGADSATLSRSVQNMASDDIKIPPEPPGKCPVQLQDKIIDMYERMTKEGLDLNRVIQNKKNFRNPSIYEKLIDFCRIDEKGTNFPPEIYDPHIWGKESFYDELDKAQRKDMERREKEKKERTKIEFMTGTKKSSASSSEGSSAPDEKKRKTKWDAQPSGISAPLLKAPGVQNPGVVNLTATATGTKATVISAIGSLSKSKSGK